MSSPEAHQHAAPTRSAPNTSRENAIALLTHVLHDQVRAYDKLLEHARKDTPLIALAFECQMFEDIPVAAHDVFMDKVITENRVYEGLGRG